MNMNMNTTTEAIFAATFATVTEAGEHSECAPLVAVLAQFSERGYLALIEQQQTVGALGRLDKALLACAEMALSGLGGQVRSMGRLHAATAQLRAARNFLERLQALNSIVADYASMCRRPVVAPAPVPVEVAYMAIVLA